MSDRIAIIPARGGSKRVPKKNVLEFYGKPMIAWTIEAAKQTNMFKRIVVSTDDQDIAEISVEWGAEVPFLREAHADDHSPVSLATHQALLQSESHWQESYDTVVQLMPNCPIRNSKDLETAISNFDNSGADFQMSCFRFNFMNPWWAFRLNNDGSAERMFPEAITKRSQDLGELYCPTGAIWMADGAEFKNSKTFYGDNYRYDEIPWHAAVDIDDLHDLQFAKSVFQMMQTKQGN